MRLDPTWRRVGVSQALKTSFATVIADIARGQPA
jgi:hypothetical protein